MSDPSQPAPPPQQPWHKPSGPQPGPGAPAGGPVHPGYGPGPGPGAPGSFGPPPPGYGGPGGPGGFPPPGGRGPGGPGGSGGNGLIIGLVVALIASVLVVAGTFWALSGDDDADTVADDGSSQSASPSASASESGAGEDASSGTSDSPSADASESSDAASDSPSAAPSSRNGSPSGDKLKASDYDKTWDFRLGDVRLKATRIVGFDRGTCSRIEKNRRLTKRGCEYAVEISYSARNDTVRFTNVFLKMKTERGADALRKEVKQKDFKINNRGIVRNYEIGKFRAATGGDNFVVLTVATGAPSVKEATIEEYCKYANSDFSLALAFKNL